MKKNTVIVLIILILQVALCATCSAAEENIFEVVYTDLSGTVLENTPDAGDDIKVTATVAYTEEPCVYAIAVYSADGCMRKVCVFDKNIEETDTEYSFTTKYYPDGKIKLFSWDSINNQNPVRDSIEKEFSIEMSTRVYSGKIIDFDSKSITLECSDECIDGEWGNIPEENNITVNTVISPEITIYQNFDNLVYTVEEKDGECFLKNIDGVEDEIVTFNMYDIWEYSNSSMTVMVNGNEYIFDLQNDMMLYYNYVRVDTLSPELISKIRTGSEFAMLVTDDNVRILSSVDTFYGTVTGVIDEYIVSATNKYPVSCVQGELPSEGDVILANEIKDELRILKAEKIIGRFVDTEKEPVFVSGEKVYKHYNHDFYFGEQALAYVSQNKDYIVEVKKDYSAKQLICLADNNNGIITTDEGTYNASDIQYRYSDMIIENFVSRNTQTPIMAFKSEYDGAVYFESIDLLDTAEGEYIKEANALGGYFLKDTPIKAVTDYGVFDYELANGNYYNLQLYTIDGLNIYCILFDNKGFNTILTKQEMMIFESWDGGKLTGFVNGERVILDCDINLGGTRVGTFIEIRILTVDNSVFYSRKCISPANVMFEEIKPSGTNGFMNLPVIETTANAIALCSNNSERFVKVVNDDTTLLKYNPDDNTLSEISLSELNESYYACIYYNGHYAEEIVVIQRDW